MSDVYKLVREKVEKERPELASKMTNNLGFVEIHHSKCTDLCNVFLLELHLELNFERVQSLLRVNVTYERRKVSKRFGRQTRCECCWILGMTFQVSIGFSALENSDAKTDQSKICAVFISDTVLVNEVKEYVEN